MFGLSFGELLIIAVLALLLLGPERLPDAARTLGKGLRDLRKVTEDLKDQVEQEIYADDRRPAKPALVPPVPSAPGPAEPPPAATTENVPGLEAALAEPPGATEAAAATENAAPSPLAGEPSAAPGPAAPAAPAAGAATPDRAGTT